MEIAGWKARRSGRELSIARSLCSDSFEKGIFRIKATQKATSWREWIKTLGQVIYHSNSEVEIVFNGKKYVGEIDDKEAEVEFIFNIGKYK